MSQPASGPVSRHALRGYTAFHIVLSSPQCTHFTCGGKMVRGSRRAIRRREGGGGVHPARLHATHSAAAGYAMMAAGLVCGLRQEQGGAGEGGGGYEMRRSCNEQLRAFTGCTSPRVVKYQVNSFGVNTQTDRRGSEWCSTGISVTIRFLALVEPNCCVVHPAR